MKRFNHMLATAGVALLATAPLFAGGAECEAARQAEATAAAAKAAPVQDAMTASRSSAPQAVAAAPKKKCSESTQTCLDYMAKKFEGRGWVGLELDYDEAAGTMSIVQVEADSPAKRAGLARGDMLVALNGIKFSEQNKEAMSAAQAKMTVGNTVVYTVERNGSTIEVPVTLGAIPESVLAKWIGRHMLEHATVELAKN